MSDNHDLLNDNNMCSFEEHEAENVCSNKDAVACGDCSSFVPIKTRGHDRARLRPGRAGCHQCRVESNLSGNQRLCAERIWLEGFKFIYFSGKTQMWN